MKRALAILPKPRHIEFISRFGRLELEIGESERGRTLFESLLDAYPKRTDIWSVYVDLLVKRGRVEEARSVLERATQAPLSAQKIRGFFKRWLELEMSSGTAKSAAAVKEKAQLFVSQLQAKLHL